MLLLLLPPPLLLLPFLLLLLLLPQALLRVVRRCPLCGRCLRGGRGAGGHPRMRGGDATPC
jgi:hypothetical protein